jgi:hypothetical protein
VNAQGQKNLRWTSRDMQRPLRSQEIHDAARYKLGQPLDIRQVARIVGCSVWTVRQTLIPKGLPHFRLTPLGRLIFYEDQIIRWIEMKQGV